MRPLTDRVSRRRWPGMAVFVVFISLTTTAVAEDGACSSRTPLLADVRFSANAWIDESGLRAIAGVEDPGVWSDARAEEVRHRLLRTEVFRSVAFGLTEEGGGCVLVVSLDRRPIVRQVRLTGSALPRLATLRALWHWATGSEDGAPPPTDREVHRLLRLRPGNLYDEEALDRGSKRIVTRYHHAGYQSARVSTDVREDGGAVEIDVFVRPGTPLLVTEVESVVDQADARRIVDDVLSSRLGRAKVRYIERDTRRELARRLRMGGFFDSHIEVSWRPIDATSGGMTAQVGAGAQRRIEVVGNEKVGTSALLDLGRLYTRTFITSNTWRQMRRAMEAEYQRRGYFTASVELETDAADEIVYRVVEGPRFKVAEVRFEGNESLSSNELRNLVSTGHRSWLGPIRPPRAVEGVLEDDIERVRERYQRAGFENPVVARRVTLDREAGTAVVTFTVEEGPRSYLRSVAWDEASSRLGEELEPLVALGEPLDVGSVEAERDRIVARLRRIGYRDAQVDFGIRREPQAERVDADLVWDIEPGPLHRFGEIYVKGNAEVQYVVIDRDLPFVPGEPIETDELLSAQQGVSDSGLFHNVSINPVPRDESIGVQREDEDSADEEVADAAAAAVDSDPDGDEESGEIEDEVVADEVYPVEVSVAARPPGRFGYGVGYDTRQGVTGFAEVSYGNINHRAQRLRMRAQIGFDPGTSDEPTQYQVTAGFTEPRVLDGPWDFHFNTVAERNTRTIEQFNIERGSGVIGSSRKLGKRFRIGGDLQGEFARVFAVQPLPFRARDERDAWTTSISPYIVYDGRDSAFDPRSGFFESLRLRYAFPGLSTTDFIEVNAQHTHFIPLWRDWNFVYSLRAGWVQSMDGDPVVPIRQRYFVGGGESVRGFAVNSLGPYDGNGSVIGGDLALVAKSELRIPIIGGLGWVLFVDGGGNYLVRCDSTCRAGDPNDPATAIRDADPSFDNFRPTAGMGLRYITPVGPISVDYGIKLDRRTRSLADGSTAQESFGEFSVSVGARF